jgi:hypothetical protein
MLDENQIRILLKLHELEQSLAEMYALFLEKFPEHKDLWTVLVKEEMEHAEAVQKFYRLTYKKDASFSEGSIRLSAVESIIEYVKKNCEIGRRDGMDSSQALEVSRDIEKSLIAKDIFDHFKVRLEYTSLLNRLRADSERHVHLVEEAINRSKKRPYL